MKKRSPMKGLITYSFYAIDKSLISELVLLLVLGILFMVTENIMFYNFFVMSALAAAPYIFLSKSGDSSKWDRFQISMPVKRTEVIKALYLAVILLMLPGIPLIGIIWGLGYVMHESAYSFEFIMPALSAGSVLTWVALLFPLSFTKIGRNNEQILFIVCMGAAVGIMMGVLFGAIWLDIPNNILPLVMIGIASIIYIISYVITKGIYAKVDF